MSEGAYGQSQVLPCGCVGACTCFGQPFQTEDIDESGRGAGLWYTQDALGYMYLWTTNGWVDASSPETISIQADPSNYPGGMVIYVQDANFNGYWYAEDLDGNRYLWTTNGWLPTTVSADPLDSLVGPPAAGNSELAYWEQVYASGDPELIAVAESIQESRQNAAEVWTNPGGVSDESYISDRDGDNIPDHIDYAPDEYDVQDQMDVINMQPHEDEYSQFHGPDDADLDGTRNWDDPGPSDPEVTSMGDPDNSESGW